MHEKIEMFEKILEKDLKEELSKVVSAGTVSPTEVKTITDAVCLMLKLKEYEEWDEGKDYDEGYSSRRGRSATTGRYMSRDSRGSYRGGSYGRTYDARMNDGSYENGYSGHSIKDRMIDRLEGMYDEAQTEHERQIVDEWINRLESEK